MSISDKLKSGVAAGGVAGVILGGISAVGVFFGMPVAGAIFLSGLTASTAGSIVLGGIGVIGGLTLGGMLAGPAFWSVTAATAATGAALGLAAGAVTAPFKALGNTFSDWKTKRARKKNAKTNEKKQRAEQAFRSAERMGDDSVRGDKSASAEFSGKSMKTQPSHDALRSKPVSSFRPK